MTQQVWEEATIYVEATDKSEAERKAIAQANHGNVEWRFLEAPDPVQAIEVAEVQP